MCVGMRLVTCIGSVSSGKTCLLNILQEQANDGKCFSIEKQNEVLALQQEFNHKPAKEIPTQKKEYSKNSKNKKHTFERLTCSNKVAPTNNLNSTTCLESGEPNVPLAVEIKEEVKSDVRPISYSTLLGKTAPTIGVNHFEFIVDDLTLQVAGVYWQRKKKDHGICSNLKCRSTNVNCDRIDAIELRELGGQIGE
jgi:hypothetical protein